MYDPTLPKTKRERIRELILANLATEDIINRVNTTKEYVYKERGKLKREGLLVTHQSLSISNGQNEITMVKDQHDGEINTDHERPSGVDSINTYDIPPLDKSNLKLMYRAFRQGDGPSYVPAEYGVHPEISEKEYDHFLVMSSRDPRALQDKLTAEISNAPPEIQSIIDKSSKTLLTNDEIVSLIEYKRENYVYHSTRHIVLNPANYLPPGLQRPKCRICKEEQPGVIYDIKYAPWFICSKNVR